MQTIEHQIIKKVIDERGLRQTLQMIVGICEEKGNQIRANDIATAAAWQNAAQLILRAAQNPVIKSPLGGTGI